jgi:hypothetical protein
MSGEERNIQHCAAYSTPARIYPAVWQADVQRSTLILAAPPGTPIPVVSVRAPESLC